MLRTRYGWEGEGKFWALANMIGDSDLCLLDISDTRKKREVACELEMTFDQLDQYLDFLLSDECGLLVEKKKKLTTNIAQQTLGRVLAKRERNKEEYESRKKPREKTPETPIQTTESFAQKVESMFPQVRLDLKNTERRFKTIAMEYCDEAYWEKLWPQIMLLKKDAKNNVFRKITVAFIMRDSKSKKVGPLFQEICGDVNDFGDATRHLSEEEALARQG